jgi:hypothetical protein
MSNAIAVSHVPQPTSTVVVQNDEITLTPLAVAQPLTKVLADLETGCLSHQQPSSVFCACQMPCHCPSRHA